MVIIEENETNTTYIRLEGADFIDPTEATLTTTNTSTHEYEIYKTDCYENELEEFFLKEKQIQSKQGWFVPRNIIRKSICSHNKVKRTIRNCLPRKIRID